MPSTPAVTRLFEVDLTVADLERSVAFYRDVVGLAVALQLPERNGEFLWIGERGDSMLGLWSLGSAPVGISSHIAFHASLEDVLGACHALRSAGVTRLSFFGTATAEPSVIGCQAEASAEQLDSYIDLGDVLVAQAGDAVVGHLLQLVDTGNADRSEIKNMAVAEPHRGRGVGRALIEAAVERVQVQGRATLAVDTAAADIGNLHFYQRAGFRLRSVERDAFTAASGYADDTLIGGIELRDRVWLDLDVSKFPRSRG